MANVQISSTVIGVAALQRELLALGPKAQQGLAAALTQEAQTVMTAAKEIVPLDIGTLANSGHVDVPTFGSDGTVAVRLGFGGAAQDYAIVQHENLTLRHTRGRTGKYLERPFLASISGLLTRIGTRLWQQLGYGRGGGATGGAGSPSGTGTL